LFPGAFLSFLTREKCRSIFLGQAEFHSALEERKAAAAGGRIADLPTPRKFDSSGKLKNPRKLRWLKKIFLSLTTKVTTHATQNTYLFINICTQIAIYKPFINPYGDFLAALQADF